MRQRTLLLAAVGLAAIGFSERDLSACGDKFLLLGRSVSYGNLLKSSKPGNVVLYSTPKLPPAFGDGRFDLLMTVAGHHLAIVSDRPALHSALATGKVDLVLADGVVSRAIADDVSASSAAVIVPILVDAAASERASFEKDFGCILRLPSDSRKVIDALDRAMKLRARRAAPHTA
jgi:ABC-type amino acid transport substrate-binding protein